MPIMRPMAAAAAALFALAGSAQAQFPNCDPTVDNPLLLPLNSGTYPPDPAIAFPGDQTVWSTDGLEIHLSVNGGPKRQFIVQGMNYAPTQIGGSAGFTPFNDFFYSNDTATWLPLWNRDIETLRAIGVNAIRTYGAWKWEPGFNAQTPGNNPDGVAKYWKLLNFSARKVDENNNQFCFPNRSDIYAFQHPTHTPFLNRLWNGGEDPIYMWIGISIPLSLVDQNVSAARRADLEQFYRYTAKWLAKKYGDHPAVMGFVLGNEVDTAATTATSEFWDVINDLHEIVKASAPDKLTMMTFHDTPDFNKTIETGHFRGLKGPQVYEADVWGFNPYSNPKPEGNLYSRFRDFIVDCTDRLGRPCVKPLLYGEFGVPANTHAVDKEPYPIPWVAPNFVFLPNPPPAQCLSMDDLKSPPGSGGDGPVVEFRRKKTIAVELPPAVGDGFDMPQRLLQYFPGTGLKAGDNLPAALQARWIERFWGVHLRHTARNAAPASAMRYSSGGFVFEWRDEWWKGNPHPTFHSISGNNNCPPGCGGECNTGDANAAFPGGWADEQWFGVTSARTKGRTDEDPVVNENTGKLNGGADILMPRAAVVAICRMYGKCLTPLTPPKRRAAGVSRAADR